MDVQIKKESRCAVIGHGSWATGIVKILTDCGERVGWYVRNPEVLASLREEGRNSRYLSDVDFDTQHIELSDDINKIVSDADVIILAAPSAFLKSFLEGMNCSLDDKFVISAIKGIIPGDYLTVTEYLNQHYQLPYDQIGIIGGPSHAEEIALERLSYLTIACKNLDNARVMSTKLATRYIRVTISNDIYGIEYATILKNIYALSVGIAVGLGYGDNFLAVLISNGAREMDRFLNESFPFPRDTHTSAFLGDLLVTAYSPFSRNRRFGLLIGKGIHIKVALSELNGVSEGYYATESIRHVNLRHGIEMPIAQAIHEILYEGASPARTMRNLTNKLI
ncbi:MAG: NAD(P)-binding domain-containing protein [Rikenellaceae bacterium]|jgi:glycerol-3-phosphate dehydrogenase (NAD(P)+)|nr:NAD(P)-binding domain-containing protein [Rikenellaceae bacterium]